MKGGYRNTRKNKNKIIRVNNSNINNILTYDEIYNYKYSNINFNILYSK